VYGKIFSASACYRSEGIPLEKQIIAAVFCIALGVDLYLTLQQVVDLA